MKKIIVIPLIIVSSSLYPQKFNLKNIDAGFGAFSVLLKKSPRENESGGLTANLNAEFALDKHLFSLNFISGGGGGSGYLSIGGDFNFYKIDLLYGRELNIFNWIAFDINAGFGYYYQNSNLYFTDNEIKRSTVNFPIKMSLIFLQHNRLGFGLNSNYDINKLNNTFSGNLFLRYNFIK
jgi:hypothetical protein